MIEGCPPVDNGDEFRTRSSLKRRRNVFPVRSGLILATRSCEIDDGKPLVLTDSYVKDFLHFLSTDPIIQSFHLQDACCRSSDRYLIAMTLVYFKKCGMTKEQYDRFDFFCALYLAHDMEEENDEDKWEILPWALGSNWKSEIKSFIRHKNQLWKKMNFSAIVSQKCCDQILAMSSAKSHPLFLRQRQLEHGFVCHRRRQQEDKITQRVHSPQGPLWKAFSSAKPGTAETWAQLLSAHQWRSCPLCFKDPLATWIKSNAWELFHTARNLMLKYSKEMEESVLLDSGLDVDSWDDEAFSNQQLEPMSVLKCNSFRKLNRVDRSFVDIDHLQRLHHRSKLREETILDLLLES